MAFWNRIFNRIKPREGYLDKHLGGMFSWLGLESPDQKATCPEEALYLSAAKRCVTIVSGSIASLPVDVMIKNDDGSLDPTEDHVLFDLLNYEPNPNMSAFSFWQMAVCHLLLFGNFYAEIQRNGRKEIMALWPLRPDKIRPKIDSAGLLYYETLPEDKSTAKRLNRDSMFHVVGLSFDGMQGYSILDTSRSAINAGLAIESFAASYFKNALTPSAAVTLPAEKTITTKTIDQLKKSYQQSRTGWRGHHTPFILENSMKYQPINNTPENSQMLESRNFTVREICRIFGVPPFLVYVEDSDLRTSPEHQTREFQKFTLRPIITAIEGEIKRRLIKNNKDLRIKFDIKQFLSADLTSMTQYYKDMRNTGLLTINEARRAEGLPDVDPRIGDRLHMQVQWQPISVSTGGPTAPVPEVNPGNVGESGESSNEGRDDEPEDNQNG